MTRTRKPCLVEGCDQRRFSSGFCKNHYYRFQRYGDPTATPLRAASPLKSFLGETRFDSKITEDHHGCWVWTGYLGSYGYGSYYVGSLRKKVAAHRYSYEQAVGEIPAGMDIDHLCRNRACVNPRHLEPVSRKENCYRSPLWNGRKTHCSKGHEFTPENTMIGKFGTGGVRKCRTCYVAHIEELTRKRRLKAVGTTDWVKEDACGE